MKHGPKNTGKMKDKKMGTVGTSADGLMGRPPKGSSGMPKGTAGPGQSASGIIGR